MRILHLTLKKQWFYLILSGEKKEEYREIKEYWGKRLTYEMFYKSFFKEFDIVRFKLGYQKNAPQFDIECKGISIGKPISGLAEEGWLDTDVFVIKLGKVLNSKQNAAVCDATEADSSAKAG